MKEIKVPTIRLHDLVRQAEPTVIVCDIEGGEVELFEEVDLPGVRYVYMELHTRVTGGQGIRSVFESMHRAGFFYNQKVSNGDVVLFESLHQS